MTLDFKVGNALYQVVFKAEPPKRVVLPNKHIAELTWMRYGATFELLDSKIIPHDGMNLKCWEIGDKYELPLAIAKGNR